MKLQFRFMRLCVCWMAVVSRPSSPRVREARSQARKEPLCGPRVSQGSVRGHPAPRRVGPGQQPCAPTRCGPGTPAPRSLGEESEHGGVGPPAVRAAVGEESGRAARGGDRGRLLIYSSPCLRSAVIRNSSHSSVPDNLMFKKKKKSLSVHRTRRRGGVDRRRWLGELGTAPLSRSSLVCAAHS